MRAFVDKDIIIHITERGPVDIGRIPRDKRKVGLDRLRWDGEKIVDLMDLAEMWVTHNGHSFVLHAVEVPRAQKIKMSYMDRARLIIENGKIRLRTKREHNEALTNKETRIALAKARRRAGDVYDQISDIYRLMYMLILALIGDNDEAKSVLKGLLDDISQHPPNKLKTGMKAKIKERNKVLKLELS